MAWGAERLRSALNLRLPTHRSVACQAPSLRNVGAAPAAYQPSLDQQVTDGNALPDQTRRPSLECPRFCVTTGKSLEINNLLQPVWRGSIALQEIYDLLETTRLRGSTGRSSNVSVSSSSNAIGGMMASKIEGNQSDFYYSPLRLVSKYQYTPQPVSQSVSQSAGE